MTFATLPDPPPSSVDAFNRENYARLLARTLDRYSLQSFAVLDHPDLESSEFAIIRHDIDVEPADALPIAQIEHGQGARSTFMILLTSNHYNALDRRNRDIIQRLIVLGHEVALHFDAASCRIENESALNDAIRREASILSEISGVTTQTFSFHNTTDFTMACRKDRYGGLYNAYAGRLQDQVAYVSDSNGHWRFASWAEKLAEDHPRLQVLTHPESWQSAESMPAQRIARIFRDRTTEHFREYCHLLSASGRTKISDCPNALNALEQLDNSTGYSIMLDWLSDRKIAAIAAIAAQIGISNRSSPAELQAVLRDTSKSRPVPGERLVEAFTKGVETLCHFPTAD